MESHDKRVPIVMDADTPTVTDPDASRYTGSFGTITTGTGPTCISIGLPSISPICFLNEPLSCACTCATAETCAVADTRTPLGMPAKPWLRLASRLSDGVTVTPPLSSAGPDLMSKPSVRLRENEIDPGASGATPAIDGRNVVAALAPPARGLAVDASPPVAIASPSDAWAVDTT